MKAIILAAGKGKRLRPLTFKIPKPLIRVAGKEILFWILENLPNIIDEIIIVVGYKGEVIKKHLGYEFAGKKIAYVKQKELKGTAHALMMAKSFIKPNEKFLVLNGDDIHSKVDLEKLCSLEDLAVMAFEVNDPSNFGIVKVDEQHKLVTIIEKPVGLTGKEKKYHAATGAYLIDERIFKIDMVKVDSVEYGLPQTISVLARDVPVKILYAQTWISCGTFDDLVKAEKILTSDIARLFQGHDFL